MFGAYDFKPEEVYPILVDHMRSFLSKLNCHKVVLGISGGKDSTFCAYLAAKAIGKENVYGIMMPNGEQKDIQDSLRVIELTGINSLTINIEDSYKSILDALENNCIETSIDSKINLAPRLRMSILYAVAQSVNGIVLNTDNLDERILGYFTYFGDGAGSYAPIRDLTVTEVIALGKYIGIPDDLIYKKPGDGLQVLGDEDRLGLKYSELDELIRKNKYDLTLYANVMERYIKNKFKTNIVDIPGPMFDFPNYIIDEK